MNRNLTLGTRGSPLALAQSGLFAAELKALHPGLEIETKTITTSGDRIQNRFLSEVGGKGLFVKEIEDALVAGEIDLSVHSLKDMPAVLPEGLEIGCFPRRRSPADVLITTAGLTWQGLSEGARIGTSSLRRRLQLQRLRPDLRFEMLRGNIDTRIRRLEEGGFDGIVLAQAGMERLGLGLAKAVPLPIVPAPGQGTLAIEIRAADSKLIPLLAPLHHHETQQCSLAERWLMRELGGSCNLPLGVFAELKGSELRIQIFLASPDGKTSMELSTTGSAEDPIALAKELLEEIWEAGGRKILDEISHGLQGKK